MVARRNTPWHLGPFRTVVVIPRDEVAETDRQLEPGYALLLLKDAKEWELEHVADGLELPSQGGARRRLANALDHGWVVAVERAESVAALPPSREPLAATKAGVLGPKEDDFLQVLLFDASGDPIPSALVSGPVTFDVRLASGRTFKGVNVANGVGSVASIPGDEASACTLIFRGLDAPSGPGAADPPPAGPPKLGAARVRGPLVGPVQVTRSQLAEPQAGVLNATNVFQLRAELTLRIRLHDAESRPYTTSVDYRYSLGGGSPVSGTTSDGWLTVTLPGDTADTARLEWGPQNPQGAFLYVEDLVLRFDDGDDRAQAKSRLDNLGYAVGSDDAYAQAVLAFQIDYHLADRGLEAGGALPSATRTKLWSLFNSDCDATCPDDPSPASAPPPSTPEPVYESDGTGGCFS